MLFVELVLNNKKAFVANMLRMLLSGAEDGAQTRDPQLGRLMLYQLSYFRKYKGLLF